MKRLVQTYDVIPLLKCERACQRIDRTIRDSPDLFSILPDCPHVVHTEGLGLIVLHHPSLWGIQPTPTSRKKEHNRVVPLDVRVLDQELIKLFEDLALRRLFVGEEDDLGGGYAEDASQEMDETLTIVSASSQDTACLGFVLVFADGDEECEYAWSSGEYVEMDAVWGTWSN